MYPTAQCIQALEQRRGHTARLVGYLSLVNLLWAAATVGVAISAGPALVILSAPLRRLLKLVLTHVTAALARLLRALQPLWEVAAYATCAYIIGSAHLYCGLWRTVE